MKIPANMTNYAIASSSIASASNSIAKVMNSIAKASTAKVMNLITNKTNFRMITDCSVRAH